ncbi:ABC transporter substrate-binding protein [soil metagenome]
MDPEMIEAFTAETGIEVEYKTYGGTDELQAQLHSNPGDYDLIVTDDLNVSELIELRLIRMIDKAKIPNFGELSSRYTDRDFDPGNQYSVPFVWGTTLVAYRTDLVEDPEHSWELLWRPDLKGRVMMMEESFDPISVALISLGHSANTEDPTHYEKASELLVRQIEELGVRYGDDIAVRSGLVEGTVAAAMCYSGDAAWAADESELVTYFIPKEGAPLWIDNFGIARDSQNVDAAHRFIDFMTAPEVSAANCNYVWCASPLEGSKPYLDEGLLSDDRIYPSAEVLERCVILDKPGPERAMLINQAWRAMEVALRERGSDNSGVGGL